MSLLLVAAGAIVRLVVSAEGTGWSVHTAGVVLMVVGAGVVLSIACWASWGGFGHRRTVVSETHETAPRV